METNNRHKNEISTNKLIITKADKRKTVVILTQQEYDHKANNFVQDNKFTVITNNPTLHKKQTLKQCNNVLQKETLWRTPKPPRHNKITHTKYTH
jgi:hypothetical protein